MEQQKVKLLYIYANSKEITKFPIGTSTKKSFNLPISTSYLDIFKEDQNGRLLFVNLNIPPVDEFLENLKENFLIIYQTEGKDQTIELELSLVDKDDDLYFIAELYYKKVKTKPSIKKINFLDDVIKIL